MRYPTVLCFVLLASWTTCSNSFGAQPLKRNTSCRHSQIFATPDDQPQGNGPPPNVVDQRTFIEAVKVLQGSEATPEDDPAYVIGKLRVNLSMQGDPGLDLAEAPGLVLISSVSQQTADDTGIQPFDTIVEVCAGGGAFQGSTKALNLEETSEILMAASMHAVENGLTEIELELNRLIKIEYAD
mmetsp:Transcript_29546/g.48754  ORF Transcript_29546/g.48754 Transcript_29546/m.48754 type:complete len:184 (+) Transcript_29546:92-643(+)